jgi:hypothetical protein
VPESSTGEQANPQASETSSAKSAGDNDVEKLADLVYQLMIREIRLDLARTGRVRNQREG